MVKKDNLINIGLYRQLFNDRKKYFSIVEIVDLEIAQDRSAYTCQCLTYPDGLNCNLTLTSSAEASAQAEPGDLWLAVFMDGDIDQGFLINPINNMKRLMHPKVIEGETVIGSRRGKRINISNNHSARLTEPLILGNMLKDWLTDLTDIVIHLAEDLDSLKTSYNSHIHPATMGTTSATASQSSINPTTRKNALNTLKGSDRINQIQSDLAFIQEKGLFNGNN